VPGGRLRLEDPVVWKKKTKLWFKLPSVHEEMEVQRRKAMVEIHTAN
jgi:hypothetical protein